MQTSRNIKKHFISRILKLKLKIDLSDKNRASAKQLSGCFVAFLGDIYISK